MRNCKAIVNLLASYLLSDDAVEDLRVTVRYTRKEWGIKQVEIYREKHRDRFERIGKGNLIKLLVQTKQSPELQSGVSPQASGLSWDV